MTLATMSAMLTSTSFPTLAAEISLESAPPVVVRTVPVAGATDVDPGLTEIKVTYSKAMQDGGWSWSTWDEEDYPETTGQPKYLKDGRTCVLPVNLQPNKFYAIWLNSDKFKNFKDTGGRPAVPYLLTFFTGESSSGVGVGSRTAAFDSSPIEWLREAGVDLNQLDPQNALLTQVMIEEIQPDGNSRFRNVIRRINSSDEPQRKLQFQNSDFVDLQRLVDADGNSIPFTTVHSESDSKFRYSATLPKPVPPGGTLLYGSEGTTRGKVSYDAQSGVFSYRFSHSPGSGVATRRVEIHRLPSGAEVVEVLPNAKIKKQHGADGRVEVVLDQIVKPGGSVTLKYSYRLPKRELSERESATDSTLTVKDGANLSQQGWQLWQSGRPAEAIPKFELAVQLDPQNAAAWNGLGWASFNSGKPAEAVKAFRKVIELEPNHPAALNGLGQVYLSQGKYADAETYLLKAGSKAPAAWHGLARLYLLQGKFDDAEKYAEMLVDSGQADETARAMLRSAKARKLSDGLRLVIEPQLAGSTAATEDRSQAESVAKSNVGTPLDKAARKFVRLVVGKGEMTFESKPITYDELEGRLAEVPDRAHTVLELATTSDALTVEELSIFKGRMGQLVKRLGFEYLSLVGVHPLGSKGGEPPQTATGSSSNMKDALLNNDQRAVLDWTDRQFRSYFDARTFDGWSAEERAALETKLFDSLKGPRSREYYQAINTIAALRSAKALPALREIAYARRDKDNRDRWMAIRALGMIGEPRDVPELIPLVYHGNVNTRWWAQISLVRLTGQNFAKDWNAWGKWWNDDQKGQPPYIPEIIRWWSGQPEQDKLAESLAESDAKFLSNLKPKSAATETTLGASPSAEEARLKTLVEDFFRHNYRDITSREALEWGEVVPADNGNSSIRYKYRAKIWDKNTITNNEVFTFDPKGKFVSVKHIYAGPKERMTRLVEKFFGENYRDITSRETLEWGEVVPADNGNSSIRYKYRAKIWDKNTVTNDQVFTFDSQDKFVSVNKVASDSSSPP